MCVSCIRHDMSYVKELFVLLHRQQYEINEDSTFSEIMIKLKADAKTNPKLWECAIKLNRAPEWMNQMTGKDIYMRVMPKESVLFPQDEEDE